MFKEKELRNKIINTLRELFTKIKPIEVSTVRSEYSISPNLRADIAFDVSMGKKKNRKIIVEVKSQGQPRLIRMAVYQLKSIVDTNKAFYGMVAAPFISEASRRICRENKIGFIDLAGNCLIQFESVYVTVEGRPNPYPDTRPLKMIFSAKSSRAIRILLCYPQKQWYVRELSEKSGISIGLVSKLKERLLEYEYIEVTTNLKKPKFYVINPINLLEEWEKTYRFRINRVSDFYSLDNPKSIEDNIAQYCNKKKITYAFTMTSGADLIAPFLRYNQVFCYIKGSIESIIKDLNLKPVTSGPNVTIISPFDEGVFDYNQNIQNKKVVSDIQLYLDLKRYKKRGEEAADFILTERIKPLWKQNQCM